MHHKGKYNGTGAELEHVARCLNPWLGKLDVALSRFPFHGVPALSQLWAQYCCVLNLSVYHESGMRGQEESEGAGEGRVERHEA